uniref:hypothetical protein n=1 Tax=Anunuuluaehu liula TaxID=3049639 RepID=UPI003001E23D
MYMYKKLNLKKRIDLILIAIESLDLYALENTHKKYILYNILLIRFGNYIRHADTNSSLEFKQYIKGIQICYSLITQSCLNNLASEILYNVCNQIQPQLTSQYIKRFKYIYNQTQDYYNTYSEYNDLNIYNIAIVNLYIISRINNKYGIYYLIKYLYN